MKSIVVPNDCFLVSFDIVNLFPNVPPSDCVKLVRNLLNSSNLPDYVTQDLINLLLIALDQNFFNFSNVTYKQEGGLNMGSNLSPILADIFMNHIETNIIAINNLFKSHIIFWARYVDDVLAIFKGSKEDLSQFLDFINTVHPNIKFTNEIETDGIIPFLDLQIIRSENKLQFDIFRKPTTTDNIIPYQSAHPMNLKLSAFHSLFLRLLSIPLTHNAYNTDLYTIRTIAKNNGFPDSVIENLYQKVKHKLALRRITALDIIKTGQKKYFSLPYIPKLSENIAYILKKIGACFSHNVSNTLKNIFTSRAEDCDQMQRSGVYRLTCTCGCFYIGRSFRSLKTRTDEHLREITRKLNNTTTSNNNFKSTFAEHVITAKHLFNPDCAPIDILHTSSNDYITNFLEIFEILLAKQSLSDKFLNDNSDFNNVMLDSLISRNIF